MRNISDRKHSRRLFTTVFFLWMILLVAQNPSHAQLRELEIRQEPPPATIPVFRNHPDQAAVIIYSSLTNLQITSNMGIVADQSRPADGRYVLLIGPSRQTLAVRAAGFQEARIPIPNLSAREAVYFSVEPKERDPVTGEGTLILRSIPEGARIAVVGNPDFEQRTPYTFADWPAQSYRMRVTFDKHDPMEFVVTIPEGRAISRTLELVPDHGFVTIHEQGTLRVQYHGEGDLSRSPYTAGRPLELPVGRHNFELSRDLYEPATTQLEIRPGENTEWNPQLTATYGYVVVHEQGTLRIRFDGLGASNRVAYRVGQPLQVPVGNHVLELSRDHYETETVRVMVAPGRQAAWRPASRPTYGRLRVRANIPVTLFSDDNNAPPTPRGADYVHMETGNRLVRVTAPNHVTREIMVNVPAGGMVDTTITMLTLAEAEDLQRRERQPRGVIMAAADMDETEIWINGQFTGRGFVTSTVITGSHDVEFRHAAGTRRQSVYVAPAEMEHVFIELRPSRSRAILGSLFFPGRGHTYTGRSRGYIYGGAFWTAAAGSAGMWLWYDSIDSDYETALQQYQGAASLEAAAQYRSKVLSLHDDRSQVHDYFEFMVYATAAIYALNILDILVTRPPYGYRTGKMPEGFSFGASPGPGTMPVASLTWRRSF